MSAKRDGERRVRVTKFRLDGEPFVVVSLPLDAAAPAPLTEGEHEVAQLVCQGLSNAEIAKSRGTSSRTVANQIASVFRKLSVNSRSQLAARLYGGR